VILIRYNLLIYKQKKPLNDFQQREVEVKQSFNEEELLWGMTTNGR